MVAELIAGWLCQRLRGTAAGHDKLGWTSPEITIKVLTLVTALASGGSAPMRAALAQVNNQTIAPFI